MELDTRDCTEYSMYLMSFTVRCTELCHSFIVRSFTPLVLDQNYINTKNQVIKAERRILKELGFCVHVKHPHKVSSTGHFLCILTLRYYLYPRSSISLVFLRSSSCISKSLSVRRTRCLSRLHGKNSVLWNHVPFYIVDLFTMNMVWNYFSPSQTV